MVKIEKRTDNVHVHWAHPFYKISICYVKVYIEPNHLCTLKKLQRFNYVITNFELINVLKIH